MWYRMCTILTFVSKTYFTQVVRHPMTYSMHGRKNPTIYIYLACILIFKLSCNQSQTVTMVKQAMFTQPLQSVPKSQSCSIPAFSNIFKNYMSRWGKGLLREGWNNCLHRPGKILEFTLSLPPWPFLQFDPETMPWCFPLETSQQRECGWHTATWFWKTLAIEVATVCRSYWKDRRKQNKGSVPMAIIFHMWSHI